MSQPPPAPQAKRGDATSHPPPDKKHFVVPEPPLPPPASPGSRTTAPYDARYSMLDDFYDGSVHSLRSLVSEFRMNLNKLTEDIPDGVTITVNVTTPPATSVPPSKKQPKIVRKSIATQLAGVTVDTGDTQANKDINPYALGLNEPFLSIRTCLTTGFALADKLEHECTRFPERVFKIKVKSTAEIREMHANLRAKMIKDYPNITFYADASGPPTASTGYLHVHFPPMSPNYGILGDQHSDPWLRSRMGLGISGREMQYLDNLVGGEYMIHQIAAAFANKATTFLSAKPWSAKSSITVASSHLCTVLCHIDRSLLRFQEVATINHDDRRCLLIAKAALHLAGASLQLVIGFLQLAITQPIGETGWFTPTVLQPILAHAATTLLAAWEQIGQLTDIDLQTRGRWRNAITSNFGIFATAAISAATAAWQFYKVLQLEAFRIKDRARTDARDQLYAEQQKAYTEYMRSLLSPQSSSPREKAENWCRQTFPNVFKAYDDGQFLKMTRIGAGTPLMHPGGTQGHAGVPTGPQQGSPPLGQSLVAALSSLLAAWTGELARQLTPGVRP